MATLEKAVENASAALKNCGAFEAALLQQNADPVRA